MSRRESGEPLLPFDDALAHRLGRRADFGGRTYVPMFDRARLGQQALAVFELMADGRWRTLEEITQAIGLRPHQSAAVSARLRDFRKERFGGHQVHRRRRASAASGIHEYRLIVNTGGT